MGKAEDDELQAAAKAGDVNRLRAAVSKGANLEAKDSVRVLRAPVRLAHCAPLTRRAQQSGDTPLANAASYKGHVEAIRALVELGADLEAKNNVRVVFAPPSCLDRALSYNLRS